MGDAIIDMGGGASPVGKSSRRIALTPEQQTSFEDVANQLSIQVADQYHEFIEQLAQGTAQGFVVRRSVFNGLRGIERTLDPDLVEANRQEIISVLGDIVAQSFAAGIHAQRDSIIRGLQDG